MHALITIFMVPFILLNIFGGIGSGIWLGILGEWWAIGYGLLGLIGSHFLLALAMMPGLAIAAPGLYLVQKGKTVLSFPFFIASGLYTTALVSVWCLFVFWFFLSKADNDSYIPLMIWSYGVAMGPWTYMAQKEAQGGSQGTEFIMIFFAQASYITICLLAVFTRSTFVELAIVFFSIMGLEFLIKVVFSVLVAREQKHAYPTAEY